MLSGAAVVAHTAVAAEFAGSSQDPIGRVEAEIRRWVLGRLAGAMTSRCQGEELAKFAKKRHFPPLSDTAIRSRKSR